MTTEALTPEKLEHPVRIKVYGSSRSLLPPGTTWRVEKITEHQAPRGLVGEPMTEWTLIDLAPVAIARREERLRNALIGLLNALNVYERNWLTSHTGYGKVNEAKGQARAALTPEEGQAPE